MLNPYHSRIDIQEIINLQGNQYQDMLYLEQAVPAGETIDAAVNITSLGHFMLLSFTGSYTTKSLDQAVPVDDGINYLYFQMLDGSNHRQLFEDFVPANLVLSPGREKSLAAGDASQQLFLNFPFVYTFPLNSSIICRIQNASDAENTLKIAFNGIRVFPNSRNAI